MAFVIDDRLACCGLAFKQEIPRRIKREIEAEPKRRRPAKSDQDLQMLKQEGKCFYCHLSLGSYVLRNGNPVRLRLNWDHQVPYSYSQNNQGSNFVASCHVCNGIKSAFVFKTEEEARIYVQEKRTEKGYVP